MFIGLSNFEDNDPTYVGTYKAIIHKYLGSMYKLYLLIYNFAVLNNHNKKFSLPTAKYIQVKQ